jgi:hypothetical protein
MQMVEFLSGVGSDSTAPIEQQSQLTPGQRDFLENSVAGPGVGIGSLRSLENRALLNAAEQRMNPDYYRSPVHTMDWPELDMMGMPTGQTVQVPVPDSKLLPGEKIKGNVFFGGAGVDGPYIKDMVRAFDKQGITLTPANRDTWSNGTLVDLSLGVQATRFGQVPVLPLLDNFPQSGNQFNLLGYSYGSTLAAQVAIKYARGGTSVDNLVLIGSPISSDFLKTLQTEPNIRNVVVVNLTDKGDPITAGMSNPSLIGAAPTLAKQMLNGTGQGHFYYEPSTPLVQVRRDALAKYLYQRGLR